MLLFFFLVSKSDSTFEILIFRYKFLPWVSRFYNYVVFDIKKRYIKNVLFLWLKVKKVKYKLAKWLNAKENCAIPAVKKIVLPNIWVSILLKT